MNLGYNAKNDALVIMLKLDEIERFVRMCKIVSEHEGFKDLVKIPPPEFFEKVNESYQEVTSVVFATLYYDFGIVVLGELSIAMAYEGMDTLGMENFLDKVGKLHAARPTMN